MLGKDGKNFVIKKLSFSSVVVTNSDGSLGYSSCEHTALVLPHSTCGNSRFAGCRERGVPTEDLLPFSHSLLKNVFN